MRHERGQPVRNRRGEFATVRNPIDLYYIVRDGAIVAAKSDHDPLKDPAEVTQHAWDAARYALGSTWGRIPPAREICRQLRDQAGKSYEWRELLTTVFDDSIDFVQHHAQRLSEPARALSDELVYWALNPVARALGASSLRQHEYDLGREQLLEVGGRSTRTRAVLTRTLPTRNQITRHCGSWDRALEIANLQPRRSTPPRTQQALSIPNAVGFFYLQYGYLPSQKQLYSFVRRQRVSCESSRARLWEEWLAEACSLITRQGLPQPNPYPSKIPPRGWEPVPFDADTLPPRQTPEYSRLQVLEAAYEFKVNLRATGTPSDRRYKAFAHGKLNIPSLGVIRTHGGLAELLTELARPEWRERALHDVQEAYQHQTDTPEQSTPSTRSATDGRRGPRRRNPQKRLAILRMLRDQGPLPNRAIAEALGVSKTTVIALAKDIKARGFIETTEEYPNSPDQRYRLTAVGKEALGDETSLREVLSTPVDVLALAEPTTALGA